MCYCQSSDMVGGEMCASTCDDGCYPQCIIIADILVSATVQPCTSQFMIRCIPSTS